MTLEDFLDRLEGVIPAGTGYNAICPGHDDSSPSLGIFDSGDKIGLTCYAGCETEDVLKEMGLTFRDLFYDSMPNLAEPEVVYSYTDEEGQELFQVLRFPGKKFRQRHRDESGEWVWNLDGVRRVPYQLPGLLQGIREGKMVYVVEGEKDADRLRSIGRVATCSSGGAGKWRPEYAEFLRDAKVCIVIDKDEPGRAHGEKVREALIGVAKAIFVYQAKVGKDISDHLDANHELSELVPVRKKVRRGVMTARELADHALEELAMTPNDIPGYMLLDNVPLVLRQGRLYSLGGYTGDGKSTLGVQAARRWCSEGKHVTYFTLEMPERDLRNALLAHKGLPLSALEEPWKIHGNEEWMRLYREGVEEIASWNLDIVFESSGLNAEKITEIVRDRESDIVVIDHLHRLAWGHERRKFEEQVTEITNLALDQNIMLLVLCQLREPRQYGKDVEMYPRPSLQSFRESGVIAQDSSMALGLWRQRDQTGITYVGQTEVILLKNRHVTSTHDEAGRSWFVDYDHGTRTLLRKTVGGIA